MPKSTCQARDRRASPHHPPYKLLRRTMPQPRPLPTPPQHTIQKIKLITIVILKLFPTTTTMASSSTTPPPTTFRSAPPEAIYSTKEALLSAIQAHSRDNGYAIKIRSTQKNRILYDCDRAGIYDSKGKNPAIHSSRQRNNTGSKKCGCKMRVARVYDNIGS